MTASDALKGVRWAATQLARAEKTRVEAQDALREHCRWAQAEGVAIERIADGGRLSVQEVRNLLGEPTGRPAENATQRR